MRVFWGLLCFFIVQNVYAFDTEVANSKSVKSATRVAKAILGDPSYLTQLDSVLEYIYQTAVKATENSQSLRREQEKWLEKRPENHEKLRLAYENRICALLAQPVCFQSVMRDFF